MDVYRTKDPKENTGFSLDWALEPGETLTENLGWLVVPALDGLRVRGSDMTDDRTVAFLTGGVAGKLYHVSQRVKTSTGRVLSGAMLVRVREGG